MNPFITDTGEVFGSFTKFGGNDNYWEIVISIFCVSCVIILLFSRSGNWLNQMRNNGMVNDDRRILTVTHATEVPMKRLENLFYLKLADDRPSSLEEGVQLDLLSCATSTNVSCFWAVEIEPFFKELFSPLDKFKKRIASGEWLQGDKEQTNIAVCAERVQVTSAASKQHLSIACLDLESIKQSLGERLPRRKYPLVVVVWTNDPAAAVFGLVSAFHLADCQCKTASYCVAQYLKTSDNRTFSLQSIYEDKPSTLAEQASAASSGACVICLSRPAECVLLPCRHRCACLQCMAHAPARAAEICPLCRGNVVSYFVTSLADGEGSHPCHA